MLFDHDNPETDARHLATLIIESGSIDSGARLLSAAFRAAPVKESNTDDIAETLAFLYYLKQDQGPRFMMGGRHLGDVFEAACRICGVDHVKVETAFSQSA